ncbi:MAG: PAS domain-containing protein [Myxococcales bacterium]|nr:PAS domain-containing protein [Myxococcales bacterium]
MTLPFDAVFRASPVPQALVQLSTSVLVAVNPAFAALAERSEAELLGLTNTGLFEPAKREELRARVLGGEAVREVPVELTRPSGEKRSVLLSLDPVGSDLLLVTAEDITEQRRAELALGHSQDLSALVLGALDEAVAVLDADARYLLFSPKMEELSGCPAERALGRHPWEVLTNPAPGLGQRVARALAGETIDAPGLEITPPGKPPRRVDLFARPVLSVERAVRGVVVRLTDVTALSEARARYQDLFENAPDAYLSVDGQTGTLIECNRGLERLTGFSASEVIGRPVFELYHPSSLAAGRAAFAEFQRTGKIDDLELEVLRKDGSAVDVSLHVTAIRDASGAIVRSRSIWRDISRRKRDETKLRELAVALQNVREEEGKRIARELHDELGQAMTALQLDLGWLERHLPTGASELHQRLAAARALIDENLQLARRLSSELRPALLDDLGLPAAMGWLCREFEGRTAIRCTLHVPEGPGALTEPQRTALFRVLQEALTNVARHARAEQVEVRLDLGPGGAVLGVHDDGVGIPEGSPRGLGMLGMQERLRAVGGELEVERRPGGGTAVRARLPA